MVETTGLETSQYRVGMVPPQVSWSLSAPVVAPAEVSCPRLPEAPALLQVSSCLLPATMVEVQRRPWQYYRIYP